MVKAETGSTILYLRNATSRGCIMVMQNSCELCILFQFVCLEIASVAGCPEAICDLMLIPVLQAVNKE